MTIWIQIYNISSRTYFNPNIMHSQVPKFTKTNNKLMYLFKEPFDFDHLFISPFPTNLWCTTRRKIPWAIMLFCQFHNQLGSWTKWPLCNMLFRIVFQHSRTAPTPTIVSTIQNACFNAPQLYWGYCSNPMSYTQRNEQKIWIFEFGKLLKFDLRRVAVWSLSGEMNAFFFFIN